MLAYANDDEEVSGAASVDAGVALARDAYALAIAGARLHPHLQGLGAFYYAFAVAYRAGALHFAGAMATRAGHVELHAATGLGNLTAAMALRTGRRRAHESRAVTVRACIQAGDV